MSDENKEKNNKSKEIKVVEGNGDIEISPVSSHLEIQKPKNKQKKEDIIIPKEKK